MITPERVERYKQLALAAVAARAKNPLAPGISCVSVTPHDLLDLVHGYDELARRVAEEVSSEP